LSDDPDADDEPTLTRARAEIRIANRTGMLI
jgi:hypothetical protein